MGRREEQEGGAASITHYTESSAYSRESQRRLPVGTRQLVFNSYVAYSACMFEIDGKQKAKKLLTSLSFASILSAHASDFLNSKARVQQN